ncbi:MAG: aryl-sulfate sulfotransferase [Clostridium sp.]|jgi:hypothetical protein|nr:aryl-sulfate sulfotransferase [Clostridium sp.]
MGFPTIYPTGVTLYKKDKAFNGYTVYPSVKGALVIDMNGNEVKLWAGLDGFPNKLLPGGFILGSTGKRSPKRGYQDQLDLVQVDWDGKIVWKFDKTELIKDPGEDARYIARQHHDYQREGSATGYYAPGAEAYTDHGNTLILTHENVYNHNISDKRLIDDKIIEVTWEGETVWTWKASDHFEELGFSESAKNVLFRNPGLRGENGDLGGDWMHINSISTLGENKWYDAGDERFHPDNIVFDARNSNILAIISKETGRIVWRIGPDFRETESTRKLGWIIGQHHLHLIPKGLPGEGNLLVFDNGGHAGYGEPNPASVTGNDNAARDYSRVLEFNPVTLEIVWQYTPLEAGSTLFTDASKFYSSYISSAQRLPNGNTLITEGSDGRLIEVTPEHEIVWEYINPYFHTIFDKFTNNMIYRAYRAPYEWIPQLDQPREVSVEPIDISTFRVPGAAKGPVDGAVTYIEGLDPDRKISTGMSVADDEDEPVNFCNATITRDSTGG